MSDEILRYIILFLMLALAIGALVPSLLRVGREKASVEREDKAYGTAVPEALKRQMAQLEEDRKSGAVTAEQYEVLASDIRRPPRRKLFWTCGDGDRCGRHCCGFDRALRF